MNPEQSDLGTYCLRYRQADERADNKSWDKGKMPFILKEQNVSKCHLLQITVKPVYNSHSQKDQKLVFKTNYCLMQVKSVAECSKGSILQ